MPTLSPMQREAYEAFTALWKHKGIPRPRATKIFLDLFGYSEVPYFMNLTIEECDKIINGLRAERLFTYLSEAGRQTGVCEVCGRELTDPASISAGIGPVCAGKVKAPGTLAELL